MLHLHGFSAWVSVDNTELEQHNIEISTDGRTVTCWIASEEGKKFAVYWKDPQRLFNTAGELTVDGHCCGYKGLGRHRLLPDTGTVFFGKVRTSSTTERDLMFSRLELTDDDTAYLESPASLKDLGAIHVKIDRAEFSPDIQYDSEHFKTRVLDDQKVHERSKKAGTHRVQLGKEVQSPFQGAIRMKRLETLVTFIFKYRPMDILVAHGIVERPTAPGKRRASTSPEPEVKEDPETEGETDTQREIRALEERLSALRKQNSSGRKRVKVESINHRGVFVQGEIIDLT